MSESVEVIVRDSSGKEKSKKAVSASILSVKTDPGVVHQAVRLNRAKKRAGTSSVQTRAEMTGGGAKPWKQKGTGRARAGSNTSPLWVGGGIAHGPKVRDYDFWMNRKEKKAALRAVLSQRFAEAQLVVVDNMGLEKPSTKSGVALLQRLGIEQGSKALIVVDSVTGAEAKSFRNIPGIKVTVAAGLNTFDVLNAKTIVFSSEAFAKAETTLA